MGATICAVVLVAEHDSKRRRSERRNMMYRSKRSGMTVDYYELCMKLYCVVSNRIPNGSGSLCIGEAHTYMYKRVWTNGFEHEHTPIGVEISTVEDKSVESITSVHMCDLETTLPVPGTSVTKRHQWKYFNYIDYKRWKTQWWIHSCKIQTWSLL